jgi:cobaltochelatase CobS
MTEGTAFSVPVVKAPGSPATAELPDIEIVSVESKEAFGIGFGKDGSKNKEIRAYKGFTRAHGVPDIDKYYVFQEEITRNMLMGMMAGGLIYMHGPTGSGKTTLPEQFAARTGRPYYRQQFHQEMEASELTGTWTVVEGGHMMFLYSGLAEALKLPSVIVFDEFDSGNPAVTAIAQALLEGKPLVIANKGGEHIDKHPDCMIVGTGNTNGMGDETGLYTSTTVQSFATMNRFQMHLPVDYMPAELEIGLLEKMFGETKSLPTEIIKKMIKVANLIRDGFTTQKISGVMSTRQVVYWAKWLCMNGDVGRSFALSFANQLGAADRAVCDELFQRVFGERSS